LPYFVLLLRRYHLSPLPDPSRRWPPLLTRIATIRRPTPSPSQPTISTPHRPKSCAPPNSVFRCGGSSAAAFPVLARVGYNFVALSSLGSSGPAEKSLPFSALRLIRRVLERIFILLALFLPCLCLASPCICRKFQRTKQSCFAFPISTRQSLSFHLRGDLWLSRHFWRLATVFALNPRCLASSLRQVSLPMAHGSPSRQYDGDPGLRHPRTAAYPSI